MIGRAAVAAAAIAVLGGGVYAIADGGEEPRAASPGLAEATPGAEPAAGALAHLFVDPDGGSCTRSPTPAAYDDAAACESLDAANDACANDDTVLIKEGVYGDQAVGGSNARTAPCTMAAADARPPRFGTVSLRGVDHVTLRGIATTTFADANPLIPDSQRDVRIENASHVVVEDSDFGGFAVTNANGDVVLRRNDIGPCARFDRGNPGAKRLPFCANGRINAHPQITSGITIEGNRIHDFRCDDSEDDGVGADECHWEAMFVNVAKDLTIRGNRFEAVDATAMIYLTICCGARHGYEDVLIENNRFGEGGTTPNGISQGHCNGFRGTDLDNVVIRFNTFADTRRLATDPSGCSGAMEVVGNIIRRDAWVPCDPYVRYAHNVYVMPRGGGASGMCGSNPAFGGTTLAGATEAARDHVPAEIDCPPVDIDGDRRPRGPRCDAGADESG